MIRTAIATAAVAALVPLALTAPASTASEAAPRAAAKVKVKVEVDQDTAIAREDTLWFNGKVRPKIKGQKVVLQQRLEGKERWKKSSAAKVRKNGRFVLKDKPSAPGTRYYRVLKKAGKGVRAATSKEMKVVVYRWEQLAYWNPGPKLDLEVTGTNVGTRYYEGSLVSKTAGTPGSIEYTLGKRCVSLKATYALTDASASGATGTAKLTVDGAPKVNEALVIGPGSEIVTDVTDAFRVRFDLAGSATPAGQAAAADVEVLCTK